MVQLEQLQSSTQKLRQRPQDRAVQSGYRHTQSAEKERRKTGLLDAPSLIAVIVLVLAVGPGWPLVQEVYTSIIVQLYGTQRDDYHE